MRTQLVLATAAFWLFACARAVDSDSESTDSGHGSLTLALTGSDSAGIEYRLRNSRIEVSGYPDGYPIYPPIFDEDGGVAGGSGGVGGVPGYYYAMFSTEDDLDRTEISLRLVPGYYSVILSSWDWYLERTNEEGEWERVEQAVLLTPYYQSAYVWDGGVSRLNFRFGVDGELIDFRSGELQIGIEIEKPGEHCPGQPWGAAGGLPVDCSGSAGRGAPLPPFPQPIPIPAQQ